MKIIALADIHAGISRESTTHPGITRQANSKALEALAGLIPRFNDLNPDMVLQMGDLVRDKDVLSDSLVIKNVLKVLSGLKPPLVNISGNHDLKNLTLQEFKELFSAGGFRLNSPGVATANDTQLLWLDFDFDDKKKANLTSDSIDLIQGLLVPDKRKIAFSHFSAVKKDVRGSFYYDNDETDIRYQNTEEIKEFLERNSINLVISAHDHWAGLKEERGIKYLSLPSFSENILKSSDPNDSPGVYSVLEFEKEKTVIKSYSGDFCFVNFEF